MQNSSNFLCESAVIPRLSHNSTIPEAISECFAFVVAPSVPLSTAIITPIFLLIYSRIFIKPKLATTKLSVVKLLLSVVYLVLSLAHFVYSIFDSYNTELFNNAIVNLIFSLSATLSYIQCMRNGIVSSGLLQLDWFLQLISLIPGSILWCDIYWSPDELKIYGLVTYQIYVVISFLLLILFSFADRHSTTYENFAGSKTVNPEQKSSALSRFTFWYANPMLWKGFKGAFTFDDLWALDKRHTAEYLTTRFYAIVKNRTPASEQSRIPWIFWPLVRATWVPLLACLIFSLIIQPFILIGPLFVGWVVDSVKGGNPFWLSVLIVISMYVLYCFRECLFAKMDMYGLEAYMNAKSALINIIFDKMLKLSPSARSKTSAGEFVNLITTDVNRIRFFWFRLNEFVYAPINILVSFALLFVVLGHNAWFGIGTVFFFVPLNAYLAELQSRYEEKQMEFKDERLKLMSDVLSGIKVLKLYAWEPPIQRRIAEIRQRETVELRKLNYISMGFMEASFNMCPSLAAIACFVGYTLVGGHPLTPQIAFASMLLFQVQGAARVLAELLKTRRAITFYGYRISTCGLRQIDTSQYEKNSLFYLWAIRQELLPHPVMRYSANQLPVLVSESIRAFVSMKRISEFLDSEELDERHIRKVEAATSDIVNMANCSYTWDSINDPSASRHLSNIHLNIKKGELIGVVGRVGSGKSSLLASICGEMHKLEGDSQVFSSSVGYIPQQPWIQNKSLRDNIIFRRQYDDPYYQRTIEACALREDLNMLSAGDQTEIGERGINLSGGQKARVSLARAVYQRADLYILDDTLSAVDSHVGNHIFENVIGPQGLLKNTTRIFALNSMSFLKQCDRIVVMEDGKINDVGRYEELMSKSEGAFAEWMKEYLKKLVEQQKSKEPTIEGIDEETYRTEMDDVLKELIGSPSAGILLQRLSSSENERNFTHLYSRQASNLSVASNISDRPLCQPHLTNTVPPREGRLVEEEFAESGKVSWRMYYDYFQAFGFKIFVVYLLVLFGISSVADAVANIWMAKWTSQLAHEGSQLRNLFVYGVSAVLSCVAVGMAGFIFACGAFRASTKLHDSLVLSLLRSPMFFFDTTPMGRILNRLSNDIERVDENLAGTFAFMLILLAVVFQCIATIVVVIPLLLVLAIPLAVLFVMLVVGYSPNEMDLQRYYTATSVQLRRLVSKSWSLVTSYVQDAYLGADSIRVFNTADRFTTQMRQMGDMTIEADHTEITCNRWIQVRLDLLTQTVVFGFILIAIYLGDAGFISMGILALVITNGSTFSGFLGEIARCWKDSEMNVVGVERIQEYIANKHEAPWRVEAHAPPYNWPSIGTITFKDFCLRYREDTDLVLKHLNFTVNGGEKLGIVGRTGAGKTSLTLALFRLIEACDGTILIDGVDIRKIGLHDLRRALTIIPQDPVLFCGTLRSNLDPFDEFTDDEIWLAIGQAHLKQFVVNFDEKLQYGISEGGTNLSVGQRQLVCLARALLRKSTKILVLDEATAAVDVETDRLIQESIRQYFSSCTILTIAHRLNTILDYDKILVMDAGKVCELDSPKNLLSDSNSLFASLARNAGITVDSL